MSQFDIRDTIFRWFQLNMEIFFLRQMNVTLFIHHPNTRGGDKNIVFVVVESHVKVESHSFLYFSKIVYLQVDWITGYNGIMIDH